MLLATILDTTETRRSEQRIQFLASHDALTELPNRALLSDRLSQALAYSKRTESSDAS